jgi:hypothetical protein
MQVEFYEIPLAGAPEILRNEAYMSNFRLQIADCRFKIPNSEIQNPKSKDAFAILRR